MARLGAGAVRLLAALLVMGLAARGAAAIAIPSILATSDGGVITVTSHGPRMPCAATQTACTWLREHRTHACTTCRTFSKA